MLNARLRFANLQTEARFDSVSGEGLLSEYDGFGRLTRSTTAMGGNSRYLTYQYDPDGNRTRLTFQDGNYVTSEYDGIDRPVWIRENGVDRLGLLYYYPHAGRKIFHRLGTSTSYYYDSALRLSQLYIGYQPSAANRVDNWLAYNPANQIVADTRNNDAYAWNGHYNVDRDYTANGLNQYTAAGTTGLSYDANDNLIQSGSKTYVYDIENRLVGAGGTITLTYDPMGRLFQVTGGTGGTTQFLYDGDELVAEYDGSNVIKHRYVHGPGVDEPIAWYDGAGFGTNRRRLQENRQGSIVSVTDSAGNLIAINSYDEYGIPAATNLGRFQYTGQAWIDELGMYYYKARIYSPTLGRFMQIDPIGYEDQVNLYAYVRDDPVDQTDPSGETSPCEYTASGCGTKHVSPAEQKEHEDAGYQELEWVASAIPILGTIVVAVRYLSDTPPPREPEAATEPGSIADHSRDLPPGRSRNHLKPDPNATGPHSTFRRGPDGKISHTATYRPNARNPSGHQEVKRVDITGKAHRNPNGDVVPTPHVREAGTKGVRPARPDELPK